MERYLFIHLSIREGERQHDHRVLHTTKAKNINFAAERYVSTYWGWGEREDDFWWFHGEIIGELVKVVELTKTEYDLMREIFNERHGELYGESYLERINRQLLQSVENDLKANFRKWEVGCNNEIDTRRLADIISQKHSMRFEKAFDIAREWTGY